VSPRLGSHFTFVSTLPRTRAPIGVTAHLLWQLYRVGSELEAFLYGFPLGELLGSLAGRVPVVELGVSVTCDVQAELLELRLDSGFRLIHEALSER